jgi:hypothetical protein
MTETRHYRYTSASEAVMQGLAVDVNCRIDAGQDLPAESTVVLGHGDVITLLDDEPYEHAWLEPLDDAAWTDAVAGRLEVLKAEREAAQAEAARLAEDASDDEAPAKRKRRRRASNDDPDPGEQTDDAAPSDPQES